MPWVGPESNLGALLTGGVSPGSNPCRRALFWLAVWPGRLGTRVCSQHSARALLSKQTANHRRHSHCCKLSYKWKLRVFCWERRQ